MNSSTTIAALLAKKGDNVWSISPAASVYEAVEKMSEKSAGALLVMDGDTLAGMLSERDYARRVILQGRSSKDTKVSEIMTRDVITISPQQTVEDGMRVMTNHRIRHLPVVDGGRVVGVVTIGDLVKWLLTLHEETISQLSQYISGSYPG
jgi:CBS domain-containing protein